MTNRIQRDKNRTTALQLHYAATAWSARDAWRAKLYTPKHSDSLAAIQAEVDRDREQQIHDEERSNFDRGE